MLGFPGFHHAVPAMTIIRRVIFSAQTPRSQIPTGWGSCSNKHVRVGAGRAVRVQPENASSAGNAALQSEGFAMHTTVLPMLSALRRKASIALLAVIALCTLPARLPVVALLGIEPAWASSLSAGKYPGQSQRSIDSGYCPGALRHTYHLSNCPQIYPTGQHHLAHPTGSNLKPNNR
jgi:hypothetical protein